MEKILVFKDERKIEELNDKLIYVIDILNRNYKKIKEYNDDITVKMIYYLSFLKIDDVNSDIRNIIYDEVVKLIQSQTKYFNDTLYSDYFNNMINDLYRNHLYKNSGYWMEKKENLEELKKKNIEVIRYITSYEVDNYIHFNDDKKQFEIKEDEFNKYVDKNTFYASTKKQKIAFELLKEIDKKFEELQKIDTDLDQFLFDRVSQHLIYDRCLAETITKID